MTSPVRANRPAPRRAAPAPERIRRPDLRVVGEPSRRSRTAMVVAIAGVALFASLLASAVLYSVIVSGQARLDRLDKKIETEQQDLQRAKLALADARSPARIATLAAHRGMVLADQQSWVSPDSNAPPIVTGSTPTTDTTGLADTSTTVPSDTTQTTVPTTAGVPSNSPTVAGEAR